MNGTPGDHLRATPARSFVRPGELPGTSGAVRSALSLAARRGEIVRVRQGLYYKGAVGRYGMTAPALEEIAREVLGLVGVGPAGYSAARRLRLTTQVPAHLHLAVAGPIPEQIPGVRVHKRNNMGRRSLNEIEIAVLEVLRDPAIFIEAGWSTFLERGVDLVAAEEISIQRLTLVVAGESSRAARANFERLLDHLAVT